MRSHHVAVRFIKFLAVLMLIAAPLAGQGKKPSKKDKEQAEMLQAAGDAAYKKPDYKAAVEAYGKSLELVSVNALAHYRKGFAHYNLKEYDQAAREFTLALEQKYSALDIYRIRYHAYSELKKYDDALADIQMGQKLAPTDTELAFAPGEIFFAREMYPEAIAAYQKALQSAPANADIYFNISKIYFSSKKDPKEQAAAAEMALSKGTRYPGETHYFLGEAYQRLRQPARAIEEYQKAISSKPKLYLYDAYRHLAEIYRSENRFDDAIATVKTALIEYPNDGVLYTDKGWFLSLADRPADAIQASLAGTQILPNQPFAYTILCRAYNDAKKMELAISACNTALRYKPGDGETYFYLGRAYNLLNKDAEATTNYRMAVKGLEDDTRKNPEDSDRWYLLGNAYFTDKQNESAISAYLNCLKWSPKFAKARYNLGIIYTRTKNKPGASEQYGLLTSLDPKLAGQLKTEIDKM